jgi:hypothetical protein
MKHRSLKEPLARLSIVCLALIVSHETFQLKHGSATPHPHHNIGLIDSGATNAGAFWSLQ